MGQQPLKPMFKMGEKVLYISLNNDGKIQSDVFTVEGIIVGDYMIFYELQDLAEVVMESELLPLNEDKHTDVAVYDEQQLTFFQNFDYGDKVFVEGYGEDIYTIKGIIIEIFRYTEEEWIEISYELVHDGMTLYAYDEDMTLVCGKETQNKKDKILMSKEEREHIKKLEIDGLLDDYNDFMTLFDMFGDDEYKSLADDVLEWLQKLQKN